MDQLDSYQCFDSWLNLNKNISHFQLVYDILILYYFLVIVFTHKQIKSDCKKIFWKINKILDKQTDQVSMQEKTEQIFAIIKFGFNILYMIMYVFFGFYIKMWFTQTLHTSLTNIINVSNNYDINQAHSVYIINGIISWTCVSMLYDRTIIKKNYGTILFTFIKDIIIGGIIFTDVSKNIVELMRYNFFQTIKFEIISIIIMMLI